MKKSTTYRETFRRHRLLLSIPIVLAVAIAGFLTISSGKTYQSTASLWVDSPVTTDSSLGNLNPAITPPSTQEQGVLTELLATRGFELSVGHHSLLGPYLASHQSSGISSLLGGGGGSVDAQIIAALAPANVTTGIPGPQILQVSYLGPTPAVAQSTLKAIVTQLRHDGAAYAQSHSRSALTYYLSQVNSATRTLASARSQAEAYRAQHPTAPANDPNLAALQTAVTSASNQLSQAQGNLSQAKAALKGAAAANVVRVLDPASYPVGPTTGKKKEVEGILAGLVGGLVVSLLGTIALTRRESDPWEDELADAAAQGALAAGHGPGPTPRASHNGGLPAPAGAAAAPNGGGATLVTVDGKPRAYEADVAEAGAAAHTYTAEPQSAR